MVHAGIYINHMGYKTHTHTPFVHRSLEIQVQGITKIPGSRLSGSPLTKMRPMRLAKFMAETMTTALVTKKTGGHLGNKIPQHQFLLEDFGRLRKECVFKTSVFYHSI